MGTTMRKSRVQYNSYEWSELVEAAKPILKEKPAIDAGKLLKLAMAKTFREERRMGDGAIASHKDNFYIKVKDALENNRAVEAVKPVEVIREAIEVVKPTIDFSSATKSIENAFEQLSKQKAVVIRESTDSPDLTYLNKKIDKIESVIIELKGLFLKVITTLDPTFFVKPEEKHLVQTDKKHLLKIAVVGLIGDQSHLLSERINEEKLCLLTPYTNVKEGTVKGFSNYDYVIITRHASHAVLNTAISDLGRNKVIRLETTSVDRIVTTIKNITTSRGSL